MASAAVKAACRALPCSPDCDARPNRWTCRSPATSTATASRLPHPAHRRPDPRRRRLRALSSNWADAGVSRPSAPRNRAVTHRTRPERASFRVVRPTTASGSPLGIGSPTRRPESAPIGRRAGAPIADATQTNRIGSLQPKPARRGCPAETCHRSRLWKRTWQESTEDCHIDRSERPISESAGNRHMRFQCLTCAGRAAPNAKIG